MRISGLPKDWGEENVMEVRLEVLWWASGPPPNPKDACIHWCSMLAVVVVVVGMYSHRAHSSVRGLRQWRSSRYCRTTRAEVRCVLHIRAMAANGCVVGVQELWCCWLTTADVVVAVLQGTWCVSW